MKTFKIIFLNAMNKLDFLLFDALDKVGAMYYFEDQCTDCEYLDIETIKN